MDILFKVTTLNFQELFITSKKVARLYNIYNTAYNVACNAELNNYTNNFVITRKGTHYVSEGILLYLFFLCCFIIMLILYISLL